MTAPPSQVAERALIAAAASRPCLSLGDTVTTELALIKAELATMKQHRAIADDAWARAVRRIEMLNALIGDR